MTAATSRAIKANVSASARAGNSTRTAKSAGVRTTTHACRRRCCSKTARAYARTPRRARIPAKPEAKRPASASARQRRRRAVASASRSATRRPGLSGTPTHASASAKLAKKSATAFATTPAPAKKSTTRKTTASAGVRQIKRETAIASASTARPTAAARLVPTKSGTGSAYQNALRGASAIQTSVGAFARPGHTKSTASASRLGTSAFLVVARQPPTAHTATSMTASMAAVVFVFCRSPRTGRRCFVPTA
jgi:hypothetical protein